MGDPASNTPSHSAIDDWKKTEDRGSMLMIRLIVWIILHMGITVGRFLLYPIVAYFVLTTDTRRFSREYLQRALSRKPLPRDLFKHYYSFANMLLDRVYLLTGKHQHYRINIQGDDAVRELINQKQGFLLFGSHLGNFDVLRVLAEQIPDGKAKALMHTGHNQKVMQVFQTLNPALSDEVIEIGQPDAMIKVSEALDDGYMVGILADRVDRENKSTAFQFLGDYANFPQGPFLVAALVKRPVFITFALHKEKNIYDVYFIPLDISSLHDRKGRQENLKHVMEIYVNTLESMAKKYPYNWYNFYNFWKTSR